MKEVLKENIPYKKLSGRRAKYSLYKVGETLISCDRSEKILSERYRPIFIHDLIVSDELEKELKDYIKNDNIPHLIFYSSKGGTGKTSISQVLINEFKAEYLSISANIDRGIEAIRNKVVQFSESLSITGHWKLLSLEELGDATPVQIDAYKSIIDKYSKFIRIVMTTNSLSKLSQPLKTRFKIINFDKFSKETHKELYKKIYNRIIGIMTIENIEYDKDSLIALIKKYGFSYRELIHGLENSVKDGKLVINISDDGKESIQQILRFINDKDIHSIAKTAKNINYNLFIEELTENYLNLIVNIDMIQPMIMLMNEFQQELPQVMFPEISFVDFCSKMIKDNISFKA